MENCLLIICWTYYVSSNVRCAKVIASSFHNVDDKRHDDGHGGGGGGGGTDGFVSSLFNNNPEIPRLDLTNAAPQQEDVFSLRTFSDTGVHPYIAKALLEQGMEALTLVQSKAIPVVLSGKDALIKSQTGSGKTLAYAVPILHKLQVLFLAKNRILGFLTKIAKCFCFKRWQKQRY